jgi:integrase/recombinase XerD
VRIPKLKEEQKILSTFNPDQIRAILSFRPKGRNLTRAHMVACLLLDTGLRISEALGLRAPDIDFDNLVLKVYGKGSKERLIPMSLELRRMLFRWCQRQTSDLISATRNGTKITVRNSARLQAAWQASKHHRVRMSPHTCRHSFACEYLRRGGNLEYLRRILGHSSILTTQKYLRSLGVADLQAAHDGLSPLTVGGAGWKRGCADTNRRRNPARLTPILF